MQPVCVVSLLPPAGHLHVVSHREAFFSDFQMKGAHQAESTHMHTRSPSVVSNGETLEQWRISCCDHGRFQEFCDFFLSAVSSAVVLLHRRWWIWVCLWNQTVFPSLTAQFGLGHVRVHWKPEAPDTQHTQTDITLTFPSAIVVGAHITIY